MQNISSSFQDDGNFKFEMKNNEENLESRCKLSFMLIALAAVKKLSWYLPSEVLNFFPTKKKCTWLHLKWVVKETGQFQLVNSQKRLVA